MAIYFGGVEIEERPGESLNMFICGASGAGKGLTLQAAMSSVLPDVLLKPDHRAVLFDAKQDIISTIAGILRATLRGRPESEIRRIIDERVLITNPFDTRCSEWDMAADVTAEDTAVQIATIVIPEEPNSQNRYFPDAARELLAALIKVYIDLGGNAWGLSDVVQGCLSERNLRKVLSLTEEGRDVISTHLDGDTASKSVLSTLRTRIFPFKSVAALWKINGARGRKFSLKEFMQSNQILVLGNNQSAIAPIQAINQVLFKRITELLLDLPENRSGAHLQRCWFFLDEAKKLGRLEGLPDLMSNGRSKGAAVVLGFQDIDGLIAVYGKEVANELTALCNTFGVLKVNGISTPRWASELFSDAEVRESTHSVTTTFGGERTTNAYGTSQQVRVKPLYMASEFRTLPLPSKELGYLAGYFCSAQFGSRPYRAEIPWNELMRRICKRSETEPDFIRWPDESAKTLVAWQDEDYKRLGIAISDPTPPPEAVEEVEEVPDVKNSDDTGKGDFIDPLAQN